MACSCTSPSLYLDQCWLIISEVLCHSSEGNLTGNASDVYPWYEFENYKFEFAAGSPRAQSIKTVPNSFELNNTFINLFIQILQEFPTRLLWQFWPLCDSIVFDSYSMLLFDIIPLHYKVKKLLFIFCRHIFLIIGDNRPMDSVACFFFFFGGGGGGGGDIQEYYSPRWI